jgi:hypothetical protein
MTLLEKSAHYTIHSKTTAFWTRPKRRSFGPFLIFFLRRNFFKKKEIGGGWSHPLAQKWGGRTTPFLAKGWLRPPHTAGMGWPKPPPGLWGWSDHPESHQEKKKTKCVCAVGGGRTTPKGLGVVVGGGRSHPRPLGVARPPPTAQTHFVFFFFFLVAFEVAGPPPKAVWGGRSHPQFPLFFIF